MYHAPSKARRRRIAFELLVIPTPTRCPISLTYLIHDKLLLEGLHYPFFLESVNLGPPHPRPDQRSDPHPPLRRRRLPSPKHGVTCLNTPP